MPATEQLLECDLATTRPTLTTRLTRVLGWTASLWRAVRNRNQITGLAELDDHQLSDIGLTRGDLRSALLTSTFFEDPSSHLTRSARRRARLSLLDGLRG
jgi:uncharacterized protein YjiS (DUF1127 family)